MSASDNRSVCCVKRGACVAASLAVLLLLCASCSHEDRWGRDPAKLKEHRKPEDAEVVQARKDAMEQNPAAADENDTSPVGVLFVNGEPLTVEEVLKWIRPRLEEMAAELPPAEYARELVEVARAEIRSRAEGILLEKVAERGLGEQESKRLEQFVDQRVREIVNTEHGGRQARYEESLRERGITVAEDRARVRREMLVVAYLQRTVGNRVAEPTRRELEQAYQEYLSLQNEQQERRMSLIDIPVGDTDATGRKLSAPIPRDHARTKARRALEKLRSGVAFDEVAQEYSEGINAYNGGDWGWVTRDGVKPRWQAAVDTLYTLGTGQTSGVVETDDACFIVRCTEVKQPEIKSFAEIQPELVEFFRNKQFDGLARELVSKLYENSQVSPANPGRFLRAVVEAAPRPRQTAG